MNTINNIFELMSVHQKTDDFINFSHCSECEEHYQELKDITVQNLEYKHVENPGWDPTCFLSDDGFLYYFPGLLNIADSNKGWLYIFLPRLECKVHLFSVTELEVIFHIMETWKTSELDSDDSIDLGRVLDKIEEQITA